MHIERPLQYIVCAKICFILLTKHKTLPEKEIDRKKDRPTTNLFKYSNGMICIVGELHQIYSKISDRITSFK